MINPLFFFKNEKIKIKICNNNKYIFCIKRKSYYLFNYEEYLRQLVILYLIIIKGYPLSNILIEKKLFWGNKLFKCDILVLKYKTPYILIECKSPRKILSKENIDQLIKYGRIIDVKYYYLTNINNNFIFSIINKSIFFWGDLPYYSN